MAVKIRLKRMGKIRAPFYRVVVMDSRTKRDGRAIEEIGKYHPTEEPSLIEIDMERADYWVANGAQPTEAVAALLKLVREGNVKSKEQGPSKKERYEAAVAAAGKSPQDASAPTPKKKAEKRTEARAEDPTNVAAIEDAVEAQVTTELEAERDIKAEKPESPSEGS
ncbi:MAG TPA: 30S ribosomal protein S16 [Intrasporangium sp.]|nr:30S ribosomal protein S16 [Intrasporangium sp.]